MRTDWSAESSPPSPARAFEVRRACRNLNGDGFADLVVGARLNDAGGVDAGQAAVFFGSPGVNLEATPEGTVTGTVPGGQFGTTVAMVGDLNGDGYGDVAVAAPADGGGTVRVFFGGAGATFDTVPDAVLSRPGGGASDAFGRALGGGDLDGDRYDELIVGAPGAGGGGGLVLVFQGGSVIGAAVPESIAGGATDELGTSVAYVGDFDGDGLGDLVVGAPGGAPSGRADLHRGGAGGGLVETVPF